MDNNNIIYKIDDFYDAVLQLKSMEDCQKFFDDVCTKRELRSISQRLQVAKLLKKRKTYQEIEELTGASTATISRVNRTLQFGQSGYAIVLQKLILQDLRKEREAEGEDF